MDIKNYCSVDLLSVVYKAFTKLIPQRINNELDFNQLLKLADFRTNFNTMDHLQVINLDIQIVWIFWTMTSRMQAANECRQEISTVLGGGVTFCQKINFNLLRFSRLPFRSLVVCRMSGMTWHGRCSMPLLELNTIAGLPVVIAS
mgnify:CR=1 FL=1